MVTTARHGALGWVSVRHLQHIIALGEAAGLKVDEWLQAAGLSRAILADPETSVPVTAIESMLVDGVPTRDAIAVQLGLSGRSLHRKLQESGTGYRALLDDIGLGFACQRMSNRG